MYKVHRKKAFNEQSICPISRPALRGTEKVGVQLGQKVLPDPILGLLSSIFSTVVRVSLSCHTHSRTSFRCNPSSQ